MTQPSMREKAYQTIREWLKSQVLPRGSVSSEVQLSQRLNMSRTPVRAALQQLEMEGYLRIIPKHGILILESSAQRVGDLLDLIFSMILFAYEHSRHSELQWTAVMEFEINEIIKLVNAAEIQTTPENFSKMELRLFQQLVGLCRNLEMDRLFEQSIERLYWQANIRRWKAPYFLETKLVFTDLLAAITNYSDDFQPKLLAYLQLLKQTWV
jgi:DNA-binding GntR family transcriptional regulator